MAFIKFARTVASRANPDLEEEEDEKEVGGGADERQGTPSREEAARRVAEREERRRAEAQASRERQERETERQERDELKRFKQDAEPKLQLVERLGEVFGGRKEEQRRPVRPDPLDPDYQAKMDTYEEYLIQQAAIQAANRAHQHLTTEQQRIQAEGREMAKREANDQLVGSFFDSDIDGQANPRREWPQEKRNQLLYFAKGRLQPTGLYGNFTQEDLEIAEMRLFREEVLARAEAKAEDRIMGHLGAPRRPVRRSAGAKRTTEELDNAAIEFLNQIERMSHGRQVEAMERLEREDPEVYKYYIQALEAAKDDER